MPTGATPPATVSEPWERELHTIVTRRACGGGQMDHRGPQARGEEGRSQGAMAAVGVGAAAGKAESRKRKAETDAADVVEADSQLSALSSQLSPALPGGEPNIIAQRRGVAAVEVVTRRHAGQHIAVGTHGTLLALILQHYDLAFDAAFLQRLTMPDLYQLTLAGDGTAHIVRLWDAGDAFVPREES